MDWESMRGTTRIVHEGIGVCALITPWNWPMNQIACKVAPALVAGLHDGAGSRPRLPQCPASCSPMSATWRACLRGCSTW